MADTSGGISVTKLREVDNSTIEINASGKIQVKDNGITEPKILDNSILNADINASAGITASKLTHVIKMSSYVLAPVNITSMNFAGLSQNKLYKLVFVFKNLSGGNVNYFIRFNGVISSHYNYETLYGCASGSGAVERNNANEITLNSHTVVNNDFFSGEFIFSTQNYSGIRPTFYYNGGKHNGIYNINGHFNNATNIISMQIHSNVINGIGNRSKLLLYEMF